MPASDWIQLFNGKDLKDWVPKLVGTPAGQDPYDTWSVKDSILWVDYKNYGGQFNGHFGHLAYQKRKFSYYVFHVESNHWGTPIAGAPDWGYQNNGVMFHSQSMESMGINQDFPDCIEYQLLGENNHLNSDKTTGNGTTANMCGGGNTAIINGTRQSPQCFNSKHVQIDSSHWVVTEGLVLGDSVVKHMVSGNPSRPVDTVLTYTKIQHSGTGLPMTDGYLAIQAESTPWKFKTIKVLDLEGCMDPKFATYRSYFIKSNPAACSGTTRASDRPIPAGYALTVAHGMARLSLPRNGGLYRLAVSDIQGNLRMTQEAEPGKEARIPISGLEPGIYFLRVSGARPDGIPDAKSDYRFKFTKMAP